MGGVHCWNAAEGGIDSPALQAHPFGAPPLRCGVLRRRCAPACRTEGFSPGSRSAKNKKAPDGRVRCWNAAEGGIDSPLCAAHPLGRLRCAAASCAGAARRLCRTEGFSPGSRSAKNKKAPDGAVLFLAEREGFEPSSGSYPLPVFKTGAFDHSATSPGWVETTRGAFSRAGVFLARTCAIS